MRIYFDENFSPHLICGMKALQDHRASDGITVHSIKEDFGEGAADENWIPALAIRHGVAVSQDLNIHRTKAQWTLCQRHKVGLIFFKPPKRVGWSYWQIVQLVVRLWPELCDAARNGRPPWGKYVDGLKPKLLDL